MSAQGAATFLSPSPNARSARFFLRADVAAAIYEHGMLCPLSPLPLAEGARVEVTVTDDAASAPATESGRASDSLRAVAALPMESGDAGFSGRDHDRVLYGGSGGAL